MCSRHLLVLGLVLGVLVASCGNDTIESTGTGGGGPRCAGPGDACSDEVACCGLHCVAHACRAECGERKTQCLTVYDCCAGLVCEGGFCQ